MHLINVNKPAFFFHHFIVTVIIDLFASSKPIYVTLQEIILKRGKVWAECIQLRMICVLEMQYHLVLVFLSSYLSSILGSLGLVWQAGLVLQSRSNLQVQISLLHNIIFNFKLCFSQLYEPVHKTHQQIRFWTQNYNLTRNLFKTSQEN